MSTAEPKKRVKKPAKPHPLVYLVVNCGNSPGKVMAVLASEEDAEWFAEQLEGFSTVPDAFEVQPRTLHYGQPSNLGYNA